MDGVKVILERAYGYCCFVVFWLVLPFREGGLFIRLIKNI